MNASVEKLNLIHWITELQDISVLDKIRYIKENNNLISASEKISIKKGIEDLQEGKVRSHLQVKKRYEKWL